MDVAQLQVILEQIMDGKDVQALTIWKHHSGGWLGSLVDPRNHDIPGSTPWFPAQDLIELVDKMLAIADTYRAEKEEA